MAGHFLGTTGRKWAKKLKQLGAEPGFNEIRSKQKPTVAPPNGFKNFQGSVVRSVR